jgi:hypothetical protein
MRNRARLTVPATVPLRFLCSRRKRPTALGGSVFCGEPKNVREFSGCLCLVPPLELISGPMDLFDLTVWTVWIDSAKAIMG